MSVAIQHMGKEKIGGAHLGPTNPAVGSGAASDGEDKMDQTKDIKNPGPHDVLLGRGGGTNNHSGNVNFRQLVNKHKMRYLACSKVDKPKVAREVVQLWHGMEPPGRFLQRKDETARGPGSVKNENIIWVEVGDKKAREKASQCLRERTPDVIPYLSQLRQQQDQMTEQGVSMLQQQRQQGNEGGALPRASGQAGNFGAMQDPLRRTSAPAGMAVPHGSPQMSNRRIGIPAGMGHMQGQPNQQLGMQHQMAYQQQVLQDAYCAMERSGGLNSQHMEMMNRRLLAERQAMMQQQYANFEETMMHNNMMQNGFAPHQHFHQQQNRMMMENRMMQQNQMMRNNMMTGGNPIMQGGNLGPNHPAMLSPQHHNMTENFANMGMRTHLPDAMQQLPMGNSPRGMQNDGMGQHMAQNQQHNHRQAAESPQQQQQSKKRSPKNRTSPRNSGSSRGERPHPVKNITVQLGKDEDIEPLPYGNVADELLALSMVPDAPKSTSIPDGEGKESQGKTRQNSTLAITANKDQQRPTHLDFHPIPLDGQDDSGHQQRQPQQQQRQRDEEDSRNGGERKSEVMMQGEYRKTLEDYITNHQVAAPPVDIDDDASEEGAGFDGIDASAWIQQALHDSADLSLNDRKARRRDSRKSFMSTGTGDAQSLMSLDLTEMDHSNHSASSAHTEDLSEREHRRISAARSMASSQSLMSELSDFSGLDGL